MDRNSERLTLLRAGDLSARSWERLRSLGPLDEIMSLKLGLTQGIAKFAKSLFIQPDVLRNYLTLFPGIIKCFGPQGNCHSFFRLLSGSSSSSSSDPPPASATEMNERILDILRHTAFNIDMHRDHLRDLGLHGDIMSLPLHRLMGLAAMAQQLGVPPPVFSSYLSLFPEAICRLAPHPKTKEYCSFKRVGNVLKDAAEGARDHTEASASSAVHKAKPSTVAAVNPTILQPDATIIEEHGHQGQTFSAPDPKSLPLPTRVLASKPAPNTSVDPMSESRKTHRDSGQTANAEEDNDYDQSHLDPSSVMARLDLTAESAKGVSGVPLFDEASGLSAMYVVLVYRDACLTAWQSQ
jgi:hypothetical protein